MKILGISCYYHDSAAALLIDGKPIAALQEERFTRVKNDSSFPVQSIANVLALGKIHFSDLDAIVFYEKPLLKLDRHLESYFDRTPLNPLYFVDSFHEATQKTLWCRSLLLKELRKLYPNFDEEKLFFSEHHLSHAASAYFPSPFDSAVVLTMDGLGEWTSTSVSVAHENHLQVVKEIHYPHSLGLLYSTLTAFCGFKVNSGEYKLMGLAPYGKPRFSELFLKELIDLREDGSFQLNQEYFNFTSTQKMYANKLTRLLGVDPRVPETWIDSPYMDIAASIQFVLEKAILNITQSLWKEYQNPNLCLAGGVALNCVSNSAILRQGFFKNVWIQPAAGDAGGSLGAALALHSLHFKNSRFKSSHPDTMAGAYLGTQYSDLQIQQALDQAQLVYQKENNEDSLLQLTAQQLTEGKSVGWFDGRMEFGPRALGARSILADPHPQDMQKKLNLQIKFRESFRPFAPIVMQEKAKDWFTGLVPQSPYMLFVDRFLPNKTPLPAVTHLDNSARLQTVSAQSNPKLHRLIQLFEEKTGVPILVNTSFNVRGEPIVESPQDAILCFLKTDLDLLVLGNFLIEKNKNLDKTLTRNQETFLD